MSTLIKIILGVFVIAVVAIGIYFFFKNYVIIFFENIDAGENETIKCFLGIVRGI